MTYCFYSEELLDTSKRLRIHAPRADDGSVALTFLPPQTGRTEYNSDLSATRRLERSRHVLLERIDRLTAEAIAIEDDFNIDRWLPTDEQYMKMVEYINNRQYYRALGKLQRLVVQRLFELHKLNLSQTGNMGSERLSRSHKADVISDTLPPILLRLQGSHIPREKPSKTMQGYPECSQALQRCCAANGPSPPCLRLGQGLSLLVP